MKTPMKEQEKAAKYSLISLMVITAVTNLRRFAAVPKDILLRKTVKAISANASK